MRPMRPFTLVTGNPGKLAETRRILGIDLKADKVDLPEIQALSLEEVLRAKGREAYRQLRKPLVVEDTGLELAALNGFPGPLVKWMLQAVGAEGIAKTAHALGDPQATARCLLLYVDEQEEILGEGTTHGTLVLPPRGDGGFGWDPIFQPDGFRLTYAEIADEDKDRIGHRGRAWRDLAPRL